MKAVFSLITGAVFVLLYLTVIPLSSCTATETNAPVTDTVVIEQMKFTPAEITINQGDTILFINKDLVDHDVTEISKKWSSGALSMADTWKIAPEKSADYYCSIHVVMKGKIVVK